MSSSTSRFSEPLRRGLADLWDDLNYAQLKAELIKKNFDSAILKNMDLSMHRINEY